MAYTRLQTAYPRRSQPYWERCLGAMEDEDYEIEVLRRHHQFFGPFSYLLLEEECFNQGEKRDVSEDVKVLP